MDSDHDTNCGRFKGWKAAEDYHTVTVTVPADWRTQVLKRGLARLGGMLTLTAQQMISHGDVGSNKFKAAWLKANVDAPHKASHSLSKIDAVLHKERAQRVGGELVFEESFSQLPVGTMFEWNGAAYLLTSNRQIPWSFAG